jgi:hypothetical protein
MQVKLGNSLMLLIYMPVLKRYSVKSIVPTGGKMSIDLLPDVTLPESDPHQKRHHDTLIYVQALARIVYPAQSNAPWGFHWQAILRQSIGVDECTEDLTWTQLLDVWEWLIFSESADRLVRRRA